MTEEEATPTDSLEDPSVSAEDSNVPDPTGARDDPGTQDAISDATDSAKDEIAAAISGQPDAEPPDKTGEAQPPDGS